MAATPAPLAATFEDRRWRCLDVLLTREGHLCGADFEPAAELRPFLQNDCRLLVVGAGGLGCELLKDLALSGFGHIDVIDMDTIDVSNLNRQFLFRPEDVGKPKAEVAAAAVMRRVKGVQVVAHVGRIEDKPAEWYEQFHVFVLGLDSLEARGWMNALACGMLRYEADGSPDLSTVKPIVDGGTEGFKGHSRVIYPGFTPCFECTMWLFPPQTKFPLCTLAETPRNAAHCIEYAHLIQWGNEREGDSFDSDNPEHLHWVYEKARVRAEHFGISGVTFSHTQGVVKNIIPAIASTNAIVAASCALETFKAVTLCSKGLDNYMMYVGSEGVYTHTVPYQRDPECLICSAGLPVRVPPSASLRAFIQALVEDPRLKGRVVEPSVSHEGKNLYMRSPPVLEEMTRSNLERTLISLVGAEGPKCATLMVFDPKLKAPLRVRTQFGEGSEVMAE